MRRRELLALPAYAWIAYAKKNGIDHNRISTITDENAKSPADAIAFAKQYNLQWVELRNVPGDKRHYSDLNDAELKQAAKEFKDAGLKVSFFNSGQCKYQLPGTEPEKPRKESADAHANRVARDQAAFEKRIETLKQSVHASLALGCDKVRVFAFLRVADPEKLMPRLADILGEMSHVAGTEGAKLLLENENSCNVASCKELAEMMKIVSAKNFGYNWDALNGHHMKETVYPDGYNLLPKKKMWNVQIKGKSILNYPEDKLDWASIFTALERDGYQGELGLECHVFGAEQIAKSHEAMKEIIRVAENRRAS